MSRLSRYLMVPAAFATAAFATEAVTTPPDPSAVEPPKLVRSAPPEYPEFARSHRLTGAVVLTAHVGPNGDVEKVNIVRGPYELRAAAGTAIRNWKYTPATIAGVPVPAITTIHVIFKMHP